MTPPKSKRAKGPLADHDSTQQQGDAGPEPQPRLSINVNHATATILRDFAKAKGVTVTEAVRRLVAYGNTVFQADQEGKKVLFKDGDEIERLIIVD